MPPFKTAAAITTAAVAVQLCKRAGVDPSVQRNKHVPPPCVGGTHMPLVMPHIQCRPSAALLEVRNLQYLCTGLEANGGVIGAAHCVNTRRQRGLGCKDARHLALQEHHACVNRTQLHGRQIVSSITTYTRAHSDVGKAGHDLQPTGTLRTLSLTLFLGAAWPMRLAW